MAHDGASGHRIENAKTSERDRDRMTNLVPLRDRLLVLRRQTLLLLAERSEGENLDAGLLAIAANVQTALAAVEVVIEADGPGDTATGK